MSQEMEKGNSGEEKMVRRFGRGDLGDETGG